MIRTYVLLVPRDPVQLVSDLVDRDFEQSGGWIVELVAGRGVLCTDSSHKRTFVCGHYGKKKVRKKKRQAKGAALKKVGRYDHG
jgi:hypothetical protein